MKSTALFAAPVLVMALLAAGPSLADQAQGLSVSTQSATYKSVSVTGRTEPIEVTVELVGEGPFTWTGIMSYMTGHTGVGRDLDNSTPLQAGPNTLTVADTNLLRRGGYVFVSLAVTDVRGNTAQSRHRVPVLGKAGKPTVKSAKRHPTKRGTYVLRGKSSQYLPGDTYVIYQKAAGKKKYKILGTAHGDPQGRWTLRTKKLKAGKVYVKTASDLVVTNKKSSTFTVPKRLFKKNKARNAR